MSTIGPCLFSHGPGSRIFATTLEFGPGDPERSRRRLLDLGIAIEAFEDVSREMRTVNELRERAALEVLLSRDAGLRGRLAMLAIVA